MEEKIKRSRLGVTFTFIMSGKHVKKMIDFILKIWLFGRLFESLCSKDYPGNIFHDQIEFYGFEHELVVLVDRI